MQEKLRTRESYTLARCCSPCPGDDIVGYYSHDNLLKVHHRNCGNLKKTDAARLVKLAWSDVLEPKADFKPDSDFQDLDPTDIAVLKHHSGYGVDYSHVVARKLNIPRQTAFERHRKLTAMGLLERVRPRMIQYRKGIVDHKWIKHRNHTYYDLTEKGRAYLEYANRTGRS